VSLTEVVAIVALVGVGICLVALQRARGRVATLEQRTTMLERRLASEVVPALAASQRDAHAATRTAQRAAAAVGLTDEAPRLPLESVTAPVVRAVAFGAGARRALQRLTVPAAARRRSG
jgi:hypothetical protein